MAAPKEKHLIELMIEAGVKWPEGAEHAAQDKKTDDLCFYKGKPVRNAGFEDEWRPSGLDRPDGIVGRRINLPSLCRNWHQTIVTREQYEKALAANVGKPADMASKSNQVRESEDVPAAQSSPEYCASVMRQMPDNTIEQLTADYHAKATEADRLQAVADEALKAAKAALLALQKAGELLGLVISVDTMQKLPVQSEITDWRDLRVGDVIECIKPNSGYISAGDEGVITSITSGYLLSDFIKQKSYIYDNDHFGCKFKFIRRP